MNSHRLLRNTIRKLILESEDMSTDQAAIGGHRDRLRRELIASGYFEEPGVNREIDWQELLADEKYRQTYQDRRAIKTHWNQRAYNTPERAAFWQDPQKIITVHWIGLLEDSLKSDWVSFMKNYIEHIKSPSVRPPELSCIGHYKSIDTAISPLGVVLEPRRITFAYNGDAWTERIGTSTEEIRAAYKGSGLPKRQQTKFDPTKVMFSEEDIIKAGVRRLGEVIVDNYTFSEILLDEYWLGKENTEKIKQMISSAGLSYKLV